MLIFRKPQKATKPQLAEDQEPGFREDVTQTMTGIPTTLAGIALPSDAPLFLTLIAPHIAAGLTASVPVRLRC
jgi:hypothetical protein